MVKYIKRDTKNQVTTINNLQEKHIFNIIVLGILRAIKLISREKIKRFDRFINEINALKTLVFFIIIIVSI